MTTTAEQIKPYAPAFVACLYIAKLRTNRNQFVYGASGRRYVFKYSQEQRQCVREYTSREAFQKEELDIRGNVKNPYRVCTLMGSIDPVGAAIESVDSLINERLKVSGRDKQIALLKIARRINDAMEEMGVAPAETGPDYGHPIPKEGGEQIGNGSEMNTASEVASSSTEAVAAETSSDKPSDIPKCKNRELIRMPIDDLRTLGVRHGSTARDRATLIKFILEKQGGDK